MTREEAREALSVLKIYDAPWLREAVDMAIEALNNTTESSNDVIESENDAINKPKTIRYKLHKPIQYVTIEFDEQEDITNMGHYHEIVRCKDCRYYECGGLPCPLDVCESLGDDGFCSCGERREQ